MRFTVRASLVGCALIAGASVSGAMLFGASAMAPVAAQGARMPSPADASEYFESPAPNEHLSSPFTVRAGVHGLGVSPAATAVARTGHHDLIIDGEQGALNAPLPVTNNVVHLSNGETETQVTLSPGWHTLQLVFTDGNDMNFDPPVVSKPIRVYVRRH